MCVPVHRKEIYEQICEENRQAAVAPLPALSENPPAVPTSPVKSRKSQWSRVRRCEGAVVRQERVVTCQDWRDASPDEVAPLYAAERERWLTSSRGIPRSSSTSSSAAGWRGTSRAGLPSTRKSPEWLDVLHPSQRRASNRWTRGRAALRHPAPARRGAGFAGGVGRSRLVVFRVPEHDRDLQRARAPALQSRESLDMTLLDRAVPIPRKIHHRRSRPPWGRPQTFGHRPGARGIVRRRSGGRGLRARWRHPRAVGARRRPDSSEHQAAAASHAALKPHRSARPDPRIPPRWPLTTWVAPDAVHVAQIAVLARSETPGPAACVLTQSAPCAPARGRRAARMTPMVDGATSPQLVSLYQGSDSRSAART